MLIIANRQLLRRDFGRVHERDTFLKFCSGIQRTKKSTLDAIIEIEKTRTPMCVIQTSHRSPEAGEIWVCQIRDLASLWERRQDPSSDHLSGW